MIVPKRNNLALLALTGFFNLCQPCKPEGQMEVNNKDKTK